MADKAMGLARGSGMNAEQSGDEVAGENASGNKKAVRRGACGRSNHKTRRSQKCLCHSWSEKKFQEEVVRTSALRSAEEAARVAAVEEASEARSKGTCATSSASVATLTTWNLASAQSATLIRSRLGTSRRCRCMSQSRNFRAGHRGFRRNPSA
jgi:hypothetical protein